MNIWETMMANARQPSCMVNLGYSVLCFS